MIRITESIAIDRPADEVYSFACDYHHDPLWRTGVTRMTVMPETMPGLGTTTREVMRFMGRELVTDAEVVRHEPNRELAFRVTRGMIQAEGFRRVMASATGTTFTYHIEARPDGAWRLLSRVMEWSFRSQLRKDLRKLKELIESAVPEPA